MKKMLLTLIISLSSQVEAKILAPIETHAYIQLFQDMMGTNIKHLTIQWGRTTNDPSSYRGKVVVGYCEFKGGKPVITLDKEYWTNSPNKDIILWHEMGHCVLGRQHDTHILKNGKPASIMYPIGFNIDEEEKDYYLDELFN